MPKVATQTERERTEQRLRDLEAHAARVRGEISEAEHAIADGAAAADTAATMREDAAALGDGKAATEALARVREATGRQNEQGARLLGLNRLLRELEGQVRGARRDALVAWLPEIRAERQAALARIDTAKPGELDENMVESFVTAARLEYGLLHDLAAVGIHDFGQPAWTARWVLEERGLLRMAPSLMLNAPKGALVQGWASALQAYRQAAAA